jgi:Type II secretion system (T2SS), protein E, N-terminal domain
MNLSLKSLLPPLDLGWNRTRALCALPACHNKLLMRAVPGNRAGMNVGEAWYCSADCFATHSRNALASLSMETVLEMPRNPRLPLGLALLAKGTITEDQLRFAAARSERRGESLEVALIELEFVGEKQLAAARALQWGYPVLGQELIGQIVEADLPPTLLKAFSAVPLHYSLKTKRLVLGFVHRVEQSLLLSIEQVTGCRAEACFITPSEFVEQMDRLIATPDYEEAVVDNPGSASQMSRTLGGFAVEFGAREAGFAKCKSWIWARISGKRGTVDVMFAPKTAGAVSKQKFSTAMPEVTEALG